MSFISCGNGEALPDCTQSWQTGVHKRARTGCTQSWQKGVHKRTRTDCTSTKRTR